MKCFFYIVYVIFCLLFTRIPYVWSPFPSAFTIILKELFIIIYSACIFTSPFMFLVSVCLMILVSFRQLPVIRQRSVHFSCVGVFFCFFSFPTFGFVSLIFLWDSSVVNHEVSARFASIVLDISALARLWWVHSISSSSFSHLVQHFSAFCPGMKCVC